MSALAMGRRPRSSELPDEEDRAWLRFVRGTGLSEGDLLRLYRRVAARAPGRVMAVLFDVAAEIETEARPQDEDDDA